MIGRREALWRMMVVTGSTFIGAEYFLTGCSRPSANRTVPFSAEEMAQLDEIADTIIPPTNTPGAKDAGAGPFMAKVAHDCYDDASFESLRTGLAAIDKRGHKLHSKSFVACTPAERTAVLQQIDAEQKQYMQDRKAGEPTHFFKLMKDLTILAYFSSEIGCTKALRYQENPGSYNGDLPYKKGDRAWYNPSRRVT